MKIAVIYNRESRKVINLFGQPNREKYGLAAIRRITSSIKKGGHQVQAFEGDKDLIDNLEEFMPRTLVGERPGMAFNLGYGIQGQARYTHVPSILEMVGVPYVGSGPLAHSLALDKVVAKMLFVRRKFGLTPWSRNSFMIFALGVVTYLVFFWMEFPFHPLINITLKSLLIAAFYLGVVFRFQLSEDLIQLMRRWR